jgi:hypothetical protein
LGGRKNIISYFVVLTLICRHSQKLKLIDVRRPRLTHNDS